MIGWFATAALITAVFLTGRRSIYCWPVYLCSNVLWVLYALPGMQYPLIFVQCTLATLNVIGWRKWIKNGTV